MASGLILGEGLIATPYKTWHYLCPTDADNSRVADTKNWRERFINNYHSFTVPGRDKNVFRFMGEQVVLNWSYLSIIRRRVCLLFVRLYS